ncbi:long-chain-fatty-acid--CoA ligase 5 [Trichonephila inaurata madagascariensis]|uniref:long-chain-fatty-acid--CoA ligase n=1 Tax=Trichonephila inaurata madagascariensis TaxID=2747483 RepID=A0A8X6YCS9_9ARAC|nr:long-chain-fatty-acid--CoA ligase 5 [Trichonephila inaurata madagascariensis]
MSVTKDIINQEIDQESIEIPNSGGARKSKLVSSGNTIEFMFEDTKTLYDVLQRGCRISDNGRCYGWRKSVSDASYTWINYKQFIKRAENFSSGLLKIGLKPGQSTYVGIYSSNCLEYAITQHGCWCQSMIIIPLYDTLGPAASSFIIKQAEIETVICDTEDKVQRLISKRKEIPTLKHIIMVNNVSKETSQLAEDENIKIHFFKEIEELGEKNHAEKLLPSPSDICLVCYTSGTTGDPKGALVTHGNMVSVLSSINIFMASNPFTKDDVSISYLPLAHMLEQVVQANVLLHGGSVGFFGGDANKLVEDMKILQPTFFPAVPRVLNKIYDKAQAFINFQLKNNPQIKEKSLIERDIRKPFLDSLGGKVRCILSTAAPIHKSVLQFFTEVLGCEVMEAYGQTETCGPGTMSKSDSTHDASGNVGPPVPCNIVKLVDVPEMEYFSKNSEGEVCVKGHNIFKGYLKDPIRTAEALDAEGWLHTGDIGMWLPNGTLKIVDRKKNILKLAQGEYVSPEKIESVYSMSPYVSQVFVHGDSLERFLVGIVIPEKQIVLSKLDASLKNKPWNEICQDSTVKQLILLDIQQKGKAAGLNAIEQVKDIHLHPDVLTSDEGFLTPTSKMKRYVCRKYFAEQIERLYKSMKEKNTHN